MTFIIEKNVPIPASTTRSGGNMELLRTMEVGDSVFFAPDVVKKATRFYRVAKKLGVHVIIRKDGNGMRMWRTTAPIEALGTPIVAVAKPAAPKKKAILPKGVTKAKPVTKKRDHKAERAKRKNAAQVNPDMAAVKARVPARKAVATQ